MQRDEYEWSSGRTVGRFVLYLFLSPLFLLLILLPGIHDLPGGSGSIKSYGASIVALLALAFGVLVALGGPGDVQAYLMAGASFSVGVIASGVALFSIANDLNGRGD